MTPEIGTAIAAALIILGPPLSLLIMSLTLLLLGVPAHEVRKRALKFVDCWIKQRGLSGLAEVAKALASRSRGGETDP